VKSVIAGWLSVKAVGSVGFVGFAVNLALAVSCPAALYVPE